MNYLTDLFEIRDAIAELARAKTLWLDTEVADFQSNQPRLSLIQVLDDSTDLKGDRVLILDVLDQPEAVSDFIDKIMINPQVEKVFHNANYDKKFLGKSKAKQVTCTLEMVKKIPYYLVSLPNYRLKTLAEELCYFSPIDKLEQVGNWGRRPLTERQLQYAKMDAVYVAQVHHRLLQLNQLIEPNPATEDIEALTSRYREIEHQWKQLDTEIKHLHNRLKAAMQAQEVSEKKGFKLSLQQRVTQKVAFSELAKLTQAAGVDLDLKVTLTNALQKELGNLLEDLPVEETVSEVSQLRISEPTADEPEDELPF